MATENDHRGNKGIHGDGHKKKMWPFGVCPNCAWAILRLQMLYIVIYVQISMWTANMRDSRIESFEKGGSVALFYSHSFFIPSNRGYSDASVQGFYTRQRSSPVVKKKRLIAVYMGNLTVSFLNR